MHHLDVLTRRLVGHVQLLHGGAVRGHAMQRTRAV
jgi:hypothetical protein